jgi:hypothetical protein
LTLTPYINFKKESFSIYGIPKDFPFEAFANEVIIQICFGQNDIIFRLDGLISILVTSPIILDQDVLNEHEDVCRHAGRLLQLLHQKIDSVATDNGKDLKITFASGTTLTLCDDSEHYESYIVDVGDKKYVI